MDAIFIGKNESIGLHTGKRYNVTVKLFSLNGHDCAVRRLNESSNDRFISNDILKGVLSAILEPPSNDFIILSDKPLSSPIMLVIKDKNGRITHCPYDSAEGLLENWDFEPTSKRLELENYDPPVPKKLPTTKIIYIAAIVMMAISITAIVIRLSTNHYAVTISPNQPAQIVSSSSNTKDDKIRNNQYSANSTRAMVAETNIVLDNLDVPVSFSKQERLFFKHIMHNIQWNAKNSMKNSTDDTLMVYDYCVWTDGIVDYLTILGYNVNVRANKITWE
jgi:hypothetical protein